MPLKANENDDGLRLRACELTPLIWWLLLLDRILFICLLPQGLGQRVLAKHRTNSGSQRKRTKRKYLLFYGFFFCRENRN